MSIADAGLDPDRTDAGHSEDFSPLLKSQVTSVDAPAIRLLNSVAVHRIIEEESEVREEIEPIELCMGIGKELPSRWRIIMVVQPDRAPECVASFGGIDRSEAVERAVADRTQRNFPGRIPFCLLKGRREG